MTMKAIPVSVQPWTSLTVSTVILSKELRISKNKIQEKAQMRRNEQNPNQTAIFPIGCFPNRSRNTKVSAQDDLLKTWSGLDERFKPAMQAQWKRAKERNTIQCIVNSDGSHFVARKKEKRKTVVQAPRKEKNELDRAFAELYRVTLREDMKPQEQKDFIKINLESAFSITPDFDLWLEDKLDRERHNYFARRKRFLRKAQLHEWNYFVTITYDSKRFETEEDFRKKLRKCLSNLHTRRNWRYMGVFEY